MAKAIDITDVVGNRDSLAVYIADLYTKLDTYRRSWLSEKQELRNYIFATDTKSTSAGALPWKNSVHIPKLCQIRDNLHANYMSTLFPNDQAIKWEGDDESSEAKSKRQAIEGYMSNKLRMSGFRTEIQKCLLDLIDYGNSFGIVEYVHDTFLGDDGKEIIRYSGPKAERISPLDIVFDPTSTDFESTPKIRRKLSTIASLLVEAETKPEMAYLLPAISKSLETRNKIASSSRTDVYKNEGYLMDGFGSWKDYFLSDSVEILEFYGDVVTNGTLFRNQRITVIDRAYLVNQETLQSWLGRPAIFHCGWRIRPDNLYGMGPLDNLIGMQYRIDHLENAKADAYDLIVHPIMKISGYVEEFSYGPNERIYTDEQGDVSFLRPDTTMLSADTQIAIYEAKMEEMAGAPKQAMGFRSPGEKTAFEMQILENGANRIFLSKTAYFEEMFIEPILNAMLETSRRNMGSTDIARVMDDEYGVVDFLSVTQEDIAARGKIRPIGARHFARNANILQNLTQFSNSRLGQDTAVMAHISGKAVALLVEELLGLERYQLVSDNVRIAEQLDTQKIAQAAQQISDETQAAGAANAGGMDQGVVG